MCGTGLGWVTLVMLGALTSSVCNRSDGRGASTQPSSTQPSSGAISATAKAYLDALLQNMETYSVNKDAIDWTSFRTQVFATAGAARTIADTYPAISRALQLLNDNESFYIGLGQTLGPPPVGGCAATPPPAATLPDKVGYVQIKSTGTGQSADAIQADLRAADRAGLTGWIVDLRGNGGGDMWPMIAGVGPVLGEGIIGWIVYNDREYEREYRDGAALSLGEAFARVQDPYTLLKPYPRVAVLTDGLVNSAGEAIAVYFRARPDTRSFGTPTCGHHHLLQNFILSDRATLWLTTAQHADRMKQRYSGPIAPDEIISDPGHVLERAVAWLQEGR